MAISDDLALASDAVDRAMIAFALASGHVGSLSRDSTDSEEAGLTHLAAAVDELLTATSTLLAAVTALASA